METQIVLDWGLFWRCLAALLWGALWAAFLQYHRLGRFLAVERTWVTVVIGVGVDLLIGIGATWWALWCIVACSSLGVIARSLRNEARELEPTLNRYRTKWLMESTMDRLGDALTELERALQAESEGARLSHISLALSAAHQASRDIAAARYGEPGERK